MPRWAVGAWIALLLPTASAAFAEGLTLQLGDGPPARFAGYHLAQVQGFYVEEGLEVVLLPGQPGTTAAQALASGRAEVAVGSLPAALIARQNGLPMIAIAQPFRSSSPALGCHQAAGVAAIADLAGQTVGARFDGSQQLLTALLDRQGLAPGNVTLIDDERAEAVRDKRVACIFGEDYDEIAGLGALGVAGSVLSLSAQAIPGDGLYALETDLADAAARDRLRRFVRASMRGWRYAADHPDAALASLPQGLADAAGQRQALAAVLRLTAGSDGTMPADGYAAVVALLSSGPGAVLTTVPSPVWSDEFVQPDR